MTAELSIVISGIPAHRATMNAGTTGFFHLDLERPSSGKFRLL